MIDFILFWFYYIKYLDRSNYSENRKNLRIVPERKFFEINLLKAVSFLIVRKPQKY